MFVCLFVLQEQKGTAEAAAAAVAVAVAADPLCFKVGMRLEAKDRKNPGLVCVATITDVRDNNSKQLLIHFDGWSNAYDYWCQSDTTDIHPVGWCGRNGRVVEKPYGGCKY